MDILQNLLDIQYQFLCYNGDLCDGPSEYCSSYFKECRPCSAEICQRRGGEDFPLQCNINCIIEDVVELASRTTHFTHTVTFTAKETSISADAVTVVAKDLTEPSISGQPDVCVWVWPFIAIALVTIIQFLVLIKVSLGKRCKRLPKNKLKCNNSNGNAQPRDGNDEESETALLSTGVTELAVISETTEKKVVKTHEREASGSASTSRRKLGIIQFDAISEISEKKVANTYNGHASGSASSSLRSEVRPDCNDTYEPRSDLNSSILAKAPTLNMSTFDNDRAIVPVY